MCEYKYKSAKEWKVRVSVGCTQLSEALCVCTFIGCAHDLGLGKFEYQRIFY